jgi:monothiol glutaredoxin
MMLSNITSMVLRRGSTAASRSSSLLLARTAVRSSAVESASFLPTPGQQPSIVGCSWRFSSSSSSSGGEDDASGSGSHNDFAPKKNKTVDGEEEALAMIKNHVETNHVMLYMKGNPSQPMCGFSATVVNILKKEGVDFSSVNVLEYPAIRDGVKKYADWPTIPQLYVNGEFIGGCDIITSMHETGELKELFAEEKKQ